MCDLCDLTECEMEQDTFEIIRRHLEEYPESEPRDIVKLLYQSCFGCGHMIKDRESAYKMLEAEYNSAVKGRETDVPEEYGDMSGIARGTIASTTAKTTEKAIREADRIAGRPSANIGGGYTRVNIAALKRDELKALSDIFAASAAPASEEQNRLFERSLDLLCEYTAKKSIPARFDWEAFCSFLSEYRKICAGCDENKGLACVNDGITASGENCCAVGFSAGFSGGFAYYPPIGHSERYRELYSPHYRVVRREYFYYFDIVKAVGDCLSRYKNPIISIDGRCGSGKSTAAAVLSDVFGIQIVKADDFFLTPEQRTEDRLNEPGGNLDRERLEREVLIPLSLAAGDDDHTEFPYRPYICRKGGFGEPISALKGVPTLVEGSYSQHPELAMYYSLKIFMSCNSDIQLERIERRNGKAALEVFRNKWIPLEEKYVSHFDIPCKADLVFESADL